MIDSKQTLRINGRATLATDAPTLKLCADARRVPKLVIRVAIEDVYLHCAKAFMRSKLWGPENRIERSVLPSMGQMLQEQIGATEPGETQEQMLERYREDL